MMESTPDVASVYMAALRSGHRPVQAVIIEFGISKPEALKAISAARAAGILGGQRVADPALKALLVAEALNVRYEDLLDAVRELADGRLEVPPGH